VKWLSVSQEPRRIQPWISRSQLHLTDADTRTRTPFCASTKKKLAQMSRSHIQIQIQLQLQLRMRMRIRPQILAQIQITRLMGRLLGHIC